MAASVIAEMRRFLKEHGLKASVTRRVRSGFDTHYDVLFLSKNYKSKAAIDKAVDIFYKKFYDKYSVIATVRLESSHGRVKWGR